MIEFSPELISVVFLCVGLAFAGVTLHASKGTRCELRSGWAAAALVCLADFIIESYAARMDWWHLHGAGPVIGIPLIYPIGWTFITFHFFLLFAAVRHFLRPTAIVMAMFFCMGVCAGMVWNYLGSRYFRTLTFSKAELRDVIWVWSCLVAIGLISFQAMTYKERR